MRNFTSSFLGLLALLSAAERSMAQTPAGFSPGSTNVLPAKVGNITVNSGTYVPLGDIMPPTIAPTSYPTNGSYLLLLLDLDAPAVTNNSFSPLVHWIISLPVGTTTISETQFNASIVPYFPPSPSPGTGRHRYTLLLLSNPSKTFSWPAGVKVIDPTVVTDRFAYNVSAFVKAGGFTPLAGTYFTTDNLTTTMPIQAGVGGMAGTLASSVLGTASVLSLALSFL